MKVLVTGASGFVGKALLAEFNARGFETIAVGGPRSMDCDYSVDVSDAAAIEQLAEQKGIDAIVHTAGIAHRFADVSDDEFRRVNVLGVENISGLVEKLGVKHFLLFSSTLVYGGRLDAGPINEADECRPFDAYGQSKLDGERAACSLCETAGVDLTIFRPAPIMGEGSSGNFARLIRAIDRRKFVWVGHGGNLKSVVYVADVARAAGEVMIKGGGGTQVFNIAADAVRMKDIVNAIAARLGRNVPAVHLPLSLVRAAFSISGRLAATLDTWLSDDVYANDRLQDAYGFTPSTPLETAVAREVEYYLKHK
jgi:nucleoside-diphosphate-sugar epimerase